MRKIVAILAFALATISCSDDESPIAIPEAEVQKTLVSKITVLKDDEVEDVFYFTYDEQNRMQKLSYDEGLHSLAYTYNDADFVSRIIFNENPNTTLDFHYNDLNIPTAYEHNDDGELLPVVYEAATNYYRFGPNIFLLNDIGDIKSTTQVHYSFNDKKGMFADVVGSNIIMVNALVGQFVSVGSKVGMAEIRNNTAQMFAVEMTYDDAGYPVKIDYTGLLPLHANRTYILEY